MGVKRFFSTDVALQPELRTRRIIDDRDRVYVTKKVRKEKYGTSPTDEFITVDDASAKKKK
jgi:hypothetical protein